jgi:apolipoprotein N-acyltransferase
LNWILALATAALLVLTVPRFDLSWLAAVALAPLLIALGREWKTSRHFLMGWVAGVVYWFAVCYWIQAVLQTDGGLGMVGGWATFLLFCFFKALHLGVFAALAGLVMPKWYAAPAVAALWVGIERLHAPFGFTWFLLGNSGIDMEVPLRLAPLTGVYGVSFVFALMGCALALVALRRPRKEIAWLLVLPGLYMLPALPEAHGGTEQAVVVQPNINKDTDWTRANADAAINKLQTLSLTTALKVDEPPARLVLWPEMPAPLYYFEDPKLQQDVATLARLTKAYVMMGVVGHQSKGAPTNSVVMVSPAGDPIGRYDKIHLVPFGEFVPSPFGFVNKITTEAGDFEPGNKVVVFQAGAHKVGAFICYESVFANHVRQFVLQGADLLVNTSNDGYFARSFAREQHLKIARMRAVENRRWVIRATNDGITATIDPAGRVTERLEAYTTTAARAHYSYESGLTPYTRFGDWFAWSCLAFGLALAIVSQIPSYRR